MRVVSARPHAPRMGWLTFRRRLWQCKSSGLGLLGEPGMEERRAFRKGGENMINMWQSTVGLSTWWWRGALGGGGGEWE